MMTLLRSEESNKQQLRADPAREVVGQQDEVSSSDDRLVSSVLAEESQSVSLSNPTAPILDEEDQG